MQKNILILLSITFLGLACNQPTKVESSTVRRPTTDLRKF